MVNLEKWEEISFDDIRKGDRLKRITRHSDGTKAVVSGKAHTLEGNMWMSKHRFKLVDDSMDSKLYRRKPKPKPFKFPKGVGAVINLGNFGTNIPFVHVRGDVWHHGLTSTLYYEDEILSSFPNATPVVVSKGVAYERS